MNTHTKNVERRTFIKSGLLGGILLSVSRFGQRSPSSPSEFQVQKGHRFRGSTLDKLRRLSLKYGGEFGEVKGKNNR